MKEAKSFIDTNVFVYAHDTSAGRKHDIAKALMEKLWEEGTGVISTQVLQEFIVVVTGKLPKRIPLERATGIVENLLEWEVVSNEPGHILDACRLMKKYKYSFWDSLIINAAVRSGASILFTEDLSSGTQIEGVVITNPFANV